MTGSVEALTLTVFFDYLRDEGRSSALIRAMEEQFKACSASGKSMKFLTKEMNSLIRETFNDKQRLDLSDRLKKAGLSESMNSDVADARKVIARGAIKTVAEFKLVLALIERAKELALSHEEIDRANELLAEFERAHKATKVVKPSKPKNRASP